MQSKQIALVERIPFQASLRLALVGRRVTYPTSAEGW